MGLIFVGVKMLLLDVYKVPIWLSLGVIATSIAIAVVLSLRATRGHDRTPGPGHSSPTTPPARATDPQSGNDVHDSAQLPR